jgi:prevent-host-death family protein
MSKSRTVTMLELRRNAEEIVDRVRRGEALVLTYRGRPVVRMEPIKSARAGTDDPFYRLPQIADSEASSVDNEEIDKLVYGA